MIPKGTVVTCPYCKTKLFRVKEAILDHTRLKDIGEMLDPPQIYLMITCPAYRGGCGTPRNILTLLREVMV